VNTTGVRTLTAPLKVVGVIVALAAAFGIALGVGRLVGPVGTSPSSAGHQDAGHASAGHEGTGHEGAAATAETSAHLPGGLQVSQDGYALRVDPHAFASGPSSSLDFVIEGPDGKPVTAYTPQHEKELHLIVVRRDFSGFQHVHPTRAADGTWSTPLTLEPGTWRIFADFAPQGSEPMTLGADLFRPGSQLPALEPKEDLRTSTVEGYTVELKGDLAPGTDSDLTLSVSRAGKPVTDLDPYLGAYGHLVALRSGDLAYLHVHPEGDPGDGTTKAGPDITFGAAVPSSGTYRLFLDFKHGGVVRTAAFTVTAGTPLEKWKEETQW